MKYRKHQQHKNSCYNKQIIRLPKSRIDGYQQRTNLTKIERAALTLAIAPTQTMSGKTNLVKNRAPAPIQITAEQLLREAVDRTHPSVPLEPVVRIHDREEYQSHLRDRRKLYEDNIRYRREDIGNWIKYAKFEEENQELERARSVYERALEVVSSRSHTLWLRYAEFELRNENINHARNILDRAVQLLPRVDLLWYKYVYVEEMMQDFAKCRAIFERWMQWQPDDNAWLSYARFEMRCGHVDRAESVMRQYVNTYPSVKAFVRFAKWAEFEAQNVPLARTLFEAAFTELEPEEVKQARLFKQFASFEERQGENDRARVIYRHAIQLLNLEKLSSSTAAMEMTEPLDESEQAKRQELYTAYLTFEKKHGSRAGIEQVVITQQRSTYQRRVEQNAFDYDGWFEWARLEEQYGSTETVRETYERAVANVPPSQTNKDHWRRYIYLWIYYAVYEELSNKDLHRAAEVYDACLNIIPHKQFSFAKIWILAAQLHVRRKDLALARKLFGRAIGLCGKERIFTEYIAIESSLGEIDRCRSIFASYLKAMPYNSRAWVRYAELEKSVGETERCRALFELGVSQTTLDMPEVLWKAYIDFEIDEGEADRTRQLYERLLDKTSHVKVWISWAQFEATPVGQGINGARIIFERGYQHLKANKLSEERVLLLDAWRVLEQEKGTAESVAQVEAKMPRRIKRKRMQHDENGNDLGWKEFFDYQFPDDEGTGSGNFKMLELAAKWKASKAKAVDDDSDIDSDVD